MTSSTSLQPFVGRRDYLTNCSYVVIDSSTIVPIIMCISSLLHIKKAIQAIKCNRVIIRHLSGVPNLCEFNNNPNSLTQPQTRV